MFSIGGHLISMYQLMNALAVVGAIGMLVGLLWWKVPDRRRAAKLGIWIVLAVGVAQFFSRLTANFVYFQDWGNFWTTFWTGGNALIGAIVTAFPIFALFHRWGLGGTAYRDMELMVPPMLVLSMFSRMGCFCAGCCFGLPSNSPLALQFPEGADSSKLYGPAVRVLPIQLFEVFFALVMLLLVLFLLRRGSRYVLSLYLMGYGLFVFVIGFFNGEMQWLVSGLTVPQLLSLPMMAVGLWSMRWYRKEGKSCER